jgi:hypothetical protein
MAWELSNLDRFHAATPQLCVSCTHVLSSRVLCLAPPAVDLLEGLLVGVYIRDALVALLFAYVALLLLLLSLFLGVRAPSLSLGGSMF